MTLETPAAPERALPDGSGRRAVAADVILIGHSGQVGSAVARRLDRIRDRRGRPLLRLRETINRRVHRIRSDEGEIEHRSRAGLLAELVDRPQHAKRADAVCAGSTKPASTAKTHGSDRSRSARATLSGSSAAATIGSCSTASATMRRDG